VTETAAIKYRAFLSYSHRDKRWGEWLHRAIEGARIDKDLVATARIFPPAIRSPIKRLPRSKRPIF
jgi:eukaryotic-like serine/threonine-protein kinase